MTQPDWMAHARLEVGASTSRPKAPAGFVWRVPAIVEAWQDDEDGDTIVMGVWFSDDLFVSGVPVRAQGINAIEKHAKFGSEATAAAKALLPEGLRVMLWHDHDDKYHKRYLARIFLPDDSEFAVHMLNVLASDGQTHLAVPFMV